jgi:hypothetical protein
MQLTCTAWVQSLNTRDDGRSKTWVNYQCTKFLFSFITSLQSNPCTPWITQNTAKNNYIISYAQNRVAFRSNVLLTGIHRLLIANYERSPFPSANHCQGQLQTPVSEIYALLGCYAAQIRNSAPTFRYNLPVPPSRAKQSKKNSDHLALEDGTESFLETSVNNYQSIHNIPEEGKSHLHCSGSLKFTFSIYINADLEEMINATSHSLIQHQSVIIKAFFTRRN